MKVDFLNNTEQLISRKQEWKEFQDSIPDLCMTQTYEYILMRLTENESQKNNKLCISFVYINKSLKMIAPLFFEVKKIYGIRITSLTNIGWHRNSYFMDFLYLDVNENLIEGWYKHLKKEISYDYLYLRFIRRESIVRKYFEKNSYFYKLCPEISFESINSFDEYLELLPKKLKGNISRSKKYLEKDYGNYKLIKEVLRTDHLSMIKELSLKKEEYSKHSIFSNLKDVQLMAQIYKLFNAKIYYVIIDGNIFAYLTCFTYMRRRYIYDICYDRGYKKYNLGDILQLECIQDAIESNCNYYNYGTGVSYYKMKYAKRHLFLYNILTGKTILGCIFITFKHKKLRRHEKNKLKEA